MKPKRPLKIVYLYVVENKEKFGYKYEMILSNLKKIKELPTPVNFDKEEFEKSFQQKEDSILDNLHRVSDFLFCQSDIEEQKYIELYESLELIYRMRRKQIKILNKKKSICTILMEKCFSRFM